MTVAVKTLKVRLFLWLCKKFPSEETLICKVLYDVNKSYVKTLLEFFACKCWEIFLICMPFLSQGIIKTSYTIPNDVYFYTKYFKRLEWNQYIFIYLDSTI